MAKVYLPFNLRRLAGGAREVKIPGKTLGEVIQNLDRQFPGISERLVEDGKLRIGLAAVCGTTETRQGLRQPLDNETEVHFIQAISGGSDGVDR